MTTPSRVDFVVSVRRSSRRKQWRWRKNKSPTTTTTYDGDGNVLSVTDPDGNTVEYVYNALGQQTETIEPNAST